MKRIMLFTSILLVMAVSYAGNAHGLEQRINDVVSHLDQATFQSVRSPDWQFDYGLPGGGLLNTYEYLHSLTSFADLQQLLPMAIYVSGPHSRTQLRLTDPHSFGHYNPEFVRFFHKAVKQLISSSKFVRRTQSAMEKYGLLTQLRGLQEIYNYIENNPEEFLQYRKTYAQHLAAGDWPEGGYRDEIPEGLNQEQYWNWSETDYYFWVRRDLDGTKTLWINVIDDILRAYSRDN